MKNKTFNNSKIKNPIHLFLLVFIIIIAITVFINISNLNSKSFAIAQNAKEEKLESEENVKKEDEIITVIIDETTETETSEVVNEEKENTTQIDVSSRKQNSTSNNDTYTYNGYQYKIVGHLNIPSLNIKYPILAETSTQLLNVSLSKYWGVNPNEVGNMVVLGHNYKNNKFFGNLEKIQLGDIVKITDLSEQTLDYEVYDTYIVDPYDNSCTSQLTNGNKEITLITCHYENGNSHATKRFVVKARAN